ncbi:glycosyltransferase family 1 protein [Corynebacterium pseudotuberculosis]|uniref:Glycosyltransferase n=1 Tax=Corynebacterium pseudotuberculosis 258 TaxID=1168865 RepID=A0AAU8PIY2_CORPS|nr:glycosyltransferase family 1 protein [Corynebacterium pseudotuberculosis]AEQ05865.2 glycosyltransferase [Corynebacterium pseudotuberculosis CIP 52.97]AFB71640.2 glycosyltransferase [Corynebacterium pseudotuberculosis 316]AFK15949.2 glycosyltransferase [Corynebacterium pseudotuberculosis 258]AKS12648.1 Glycosyl transferase group 1 [Corynebacterium pseudotuberculosis]AMN69388.2 glycosyltransferase [Corynebacterium pseudotuberculosis]
MRIAIIAESFLPAVNGVTNSVLRVLEHAQRCGHEAMVIAPGARDGEEEIRSYCGASIYRVPTVMAPLINSLPIGIPLGLRELLQAFRPDVVHLASPYALAARGAFVARNLGLPCVAVFQTDIAGFSHRYHLRCLERTSWAWTRAFHNAATLTLAPSRSAAAALNAHGIERVKPWGRGVDLELFHPDRRDEELARNWGADNRIVVGYVGRLAAEKGVHRLVDLACDNNIQLVIVGDGPERKNLEKQLPCAIFTGGLTGLDLARAYASFDVFVHPGEFETFCQTIQEAKASGIPVISVAEGGPRDLIDNRSGVLLPLIHDSLVGLSQSVYEVFENREDLSKTARQSVEDKSWARVCDQLFRYYQEAMITLDNRG